MASTRSKQIAMATALLALVVVLLVLNSNAQATPLPARGELAYSFTAPDYPIVTGENGLNAVELEGFVPQGLPGDPELPSALYYLALPPLIPLDSVTLEINAVEQREIPGHYRIAPVEPALSQAGGEARPYWGPNADTIVDGKNTAVYENDAYFPADPVQLAAVSQMRKWRIAELRFTPVSYNPASGRLRQTTRVSITLRYDVPGGQRATALELRDTLWDDRAAELFVNYDEARVWYSDEADNAHAVSGTKPGYVIITTKQIKQAMDTEPKLKATYEEFKTIKEKLGYAVEVVTVEDLEPVTGPYPNERPEKIRQWLKDNYLAKNIEYVLLIGDPDPHRVFTMWQFAPDEVGDLPMKTTWPPNMRFTCNSDYTVMVGGKDAEGKDIRGFGTTKITCPDLPIRVTLTPDKTQLPSAGGNVEFTVVLANNSRSAVTITSLTDDDDNPINLGDCTVPEEGIRLTVDGISSSFTCTYSKKVTFSGDIHTETVKASGWGAYEEDKISNQDKTAITKMDNGLQVTITANPGQVLLPGGDFKEMFDLKIKNTGDKEVKITSLGHEPVRGELIETCGKDFKIAAGETHPCKYNGHIFLSVPFYLYSTDHYYADLTGNWDLDGDGMYADPGDYLPGGVDFWPDVIVGRIPVYASRDAGWVAALENILRKSVAYENSTDRDWRRSALLAMGFVGPKVDGSYLGHALETKVLADAGFTASGIHTMYLDLGDNCRSPFPSDEPLVKDGDNEVYSVYNYWKDNPVGVTVMSGHGNQDVVSFGQDCGVGTIRFNIENAKSLSSDNPELLYNKPSITFLSACSTGMPATPDNLGYVLLKTASVGTVTGTAWTYPTSPFWYSPIAGSTDQLSLSFFFLDNLITKNYSLGEALYAATRSPINSSISNALAFNLYGDPSIRMMLARPLAAGDRYDVAKGQPLVMRAPGVLANDTSANGDPRVYYLAENPEQHQPLVQELSGRHISWQSQTVPTNFGSPPSLFSPLAATAVGGKPRIYYRAVGDQIHELAYDGANWHDSNVTEKSGAPPTPAWKLTSISINGDPRLYYFSEDKHIHELAWVNDTWRHRDLTLDAGAPAATEGSPLSVATITNGDPRVFYVTPEQHIHELAYRSLTRVWSHSDLTAISGAPLITAMPNGRNALTSTTVNSLARVYYLGANQHIYELKWNKETGFRWSYSDITDDAGLSDLAYANSPLAAVTTGNGDIPRVYYIAPDGDGVSHIRELRWSREQKVWNDFDLTRQANGMPVTHDSPLAAITIRNLPHVYYLAANRHVHELAIPSQKWVDAPVTATAGGPAAVAGSGLVVTTAYDVALTASLVKNPSHGTLLFNPDGSFTYTPKANYPNTGYSAMDSFVYKVNDGIGDSAETTVDLEIVNECAPADHNLIKNYCFIEGKTPWKFFHTNNQGTYTLSQSNPYAGKSSARIEVLAPAKNIQLYQAGINLKPNTTYELAFAAYSDDGRDMNLAVHRHNHDGTYTNYGLAGRRVNLEPYWKWFVVTFTTPNIGNTSDARLRFWFAPFAKAGTVYHIDRVLLRPVP